MKTLTRTRCEGMFDDGCCVQENGVVVYYIDNKVRHTGTRVSRRNLRALIQDITWFSSSSCQNNAQQRRKYRRERSAEGPSV